MNDFIEIKTKKKLHQVNVNNIISFYEKSNGECIISMADGSEMFSIESKSEILEKVNNR